MIAAILFLAASGTAMADSKYAGFVMDAKTGKVLYESHANERRYPASLTKMMTLYLLFEAMEDGKVTKSTRVTFSRHAAGQAPSKLGIRPGQSISVETAIYALVTKSANDVACAIGEMLGGSEPYFAQMMTEKARQLGLTSTQFRNASGLPNPQQYTTARDMAMLGIALQEHFPKEYRYFSTRVFTYGNRHYPNHNKLLGRVKGVDGIKTGYTSASGFNLVTSVATGNRHIVAVVMGGRTGRSRNEQMVSLIRQYLPQASRGEKRLLLAARKSNAAHALAYAALPKTEIPKPVKRPPLKIADVIATAPKPAPAPTTELAAVPKPTAAPDNVRETVDPITTASNPPNGWVIQVASMPSKPEAMNFLSLTKSKAGNILADADGFTQQYESKGKTLYRARFAGFDSKDDAWQTCNALKKRKIACYAILQ